MQQSRFHASSAQPLLLGRSPALRAQIDALSDFAVADAPVYIYGETGTGKELVARTLHAQSLRRSRRLVAHNCGAVHDTLLQSLLFGHRRGAFTGADRDQEGVFEAAHRSSLLLDEIGEMSPALQVALLRVLEHGEVVKLGDTRPVNVDVRVISATNKRLEDEISAGRFRSDLYFRLATLRINLPPLRERLDDIRVLVSHFVSAYNARSQKAIAGAEEATLQTLERYSWPGNVRQLKNEIERACILTSPRGTIRPEALSHHVRSESFDVSSVDQAPDSLLDSGRTLPAILADTERSLLQAAISRSRANKAQAARLLGISRQRLSQRLQRWRLTTARD